MAVNLVDHRQEIVRPLALAPVNLVDADGAHVFQLPLRQAPLNKPLHRAIDAFPTGPKGPSRLSPRQPPRPTGQKAHHAEGDWSLAIAPGNMLDHHPMHRTVHSPWRVEEIGLDAPQRHEQPLALRQSVIAGGRFATFRAVAPAVAVRLKAHVYLQASLGRISKADLLIDKAREMLNPVQNRLNFQLHGWSFGLVRSIACSKRLNKPETSFFAVLTPGWTPEPRSCRVGENAEQ